MLERLRAAAHRWADPDSPARADAAERFLDATSFSEAQVAFALNEQMTALAALEALPAAAPLEATFRVEVEEGQPLPGLAEAVALLVRGARIDVPDEPSAALVSAFLHDAAPEQLADSGAEAKGRVVRAEEPPAPDASVLHLPWRVAVAVLDGKENEAARESLSEDVLLYGGATPRCVRIVWAPRGLSPDPYLETFAAFRGRFPASDSTVARVRMMTAFAQKGGLPLAYLDDHSLLVTRGAPEAQAPGHLRWVEYDAVEDVARWHAGAAGAGKIHARKGLKGLPDAALLGTSHRPGPARFVEAAEDLAAAQQAQAEK